MDTEQVIEQAKQHFGTVLQQQLERVDRLKSEGEWTDYSAIRPVIIGMIGGDGIGPTISEETRRVLEYLLRDEVTNGKVEFRNIEGLTIENRAARMQSIPDDVLEAIKQCHVSVKGPTHTPEKGDGWPNIESANVSMRKALDLFANVRPVRIPSEDIDWTFFRENTEDLYAVGSQGINVTDDLAIDFRVITTPGSERIIEAAFDHAKRTGKSRVTIVTKANVVKTTDGKFLDVARKIGEKYPDIEWDGWYIDIMTAKLIDPKRRSDFQVLALPNLYGDILTDEAAEIQGGVGTAGRRQHRQAVRHVRGHSRQRPPHGHRGPRPVRRPELPRPRGRDDARPHRLQRPRHEASHRPRHLRHVREEGRHDRPRHRRNQRRVRRLPHGNRRRPRPILPPR